MLKVLFSRTIGRSLGNCNSKEVAKCWRSSYHFTAVGYPENPVGQSCRHSRHQQHRLLSTTSVMQFAKEDELDLDEVKGKGDKVLKVRIGTTRLDAILKAGLGISRSKIEKAFYDDRIRVNGERAKKKSLMLDEGDEIDIVRGVNKMNPLFIDVSRVEIVEISDSSNKKRASDDDESDDEDASSKSPVVLKRYKNFTIQNYPVPWKGNISDDN